MLGNVIEMFYGRPLNRSGDGLVYSDDSLLRSQTKSCFLRQCVVLVKAVVLLSGRVWELGETEREAAWKLRTRLNRAPCRFLSATERSPPAWISRPHPARQCPSNTTALSFIENCIRRNHKECASLPSISRP